jgi:eukaryotic-like serine/threonine-protein kinase
LNNSLLRSGGDLIDVAPGRRLDLELSNLVVATGGSLVHAHGSPRGQLGAPIKLNLGQVSARVAGGLILLESAPDEPELPVVDIVARDSVFATTPEGTPLFRVNGQDALTTLLDRIRWEGHGVAYHQIDTYRRDQSAQPGAIPTSYDLQSWQVTVGLREASPIHGDLKFVKEWDTTRPAWTLQGEDLRLSPESRAASSGADLQRIPPAPPSNSR